MIKHFNQLTKEEIRLLIMKYRQLIKALTDEYKKRNFDGDYSYLDDIVELKQDAINLLNYLGFNNNTIYKEEVVRILNKFAKDEEWQKRHGRYSNSLLVSSIVSEVLTHYHVKYSVDDILDMKDISLEDYIKICRVIPKWCQENYWIK